MHHARRVFMGASCYYISRFMLYGLVGLLATKFSKKLFTSALTYKSLALIYFC